MAIYNCVAGESPELHLFVLVLSSQDVVAIRKEFPTTKLIAEFLFSTEAIKHEVIRVLK